MIELHIGTGCGWSARETDGGLQPDVESLAIPAEFGAPLAEWSSREVADIRAPTFAGRKEFDGEGRALALRLQQAAGERFHVVFSSWLAFDP